MVRDTPRVRYPGSMDPYHHTSSFNPLGQDFCHNVKRTVLGTSSDTGTTVQYSAVPLSRDNLSERPDHSMPKLFCPLSFVLSPNSFVLTPNPIARLRVELCSEGDWFLTSSFQDCGEVIGGLGTPVQYSTDKTTWLCPSAQPTANCAVDSLLQVHDSCKPV